MSALNPQTVPLHGSSLVEASAGTGKTHTVTNLVLRLLVERGLALDQILVVTFTVAATEDLRDRMRRSIRDLLHDLGGADRGAEALAKLTATPIEARVARDRLVEALYAFDEAAIHTIHGFCQRVLDEHAFEGQALFDREVTVDRSELLGQVIDDFWRIRTHRVSPLFLAFLRKSNVNPDMLLRFASAHTGSRSKHVMPEADESDATGAENAYAAAVERLRTAWAGGGDEVRRLLLDYDGLNRNRYRIPSIEKWFQDIGRWLRRGAAAYPAAPDLVKLTPAALAAGCKKGHSPPSHPLFRSVDAVMTCAEALEERYPSNVIALKRDCLAWVEREEPARKRRSNTLSFDDLLLNLDAALQGPGGERLAALIRRAYPAALIDEFQDTDPVQFRIFDRVYGGSDETALFLVGDPKQSIYAFRGADVFSYLAGRRNARHRLRLRENWRSAPELVEGVNALFGRARRRFIIDDIDFEPSRAAEDAPVNQAPLTTSGRREPPLRIWFLPRHAADTAEDKLIAKGRAHHVLLPALAAEMAGLLRAGSEGCVRIGDRNLEPGDLAVLVRSHRQGRLVQQALRMRGVASVVSSESSVFDTEEAGELERVLRAVVDPGDEALVKGALLTRMLGVTANALWDALEQGEAWEERLGRFVGYHHRWLAAGVLPMLRLLLAREGVPARLLAQEGGERSLTNVLHLGELLERAAQERRPGMAGLVAWLAEQRARAEAAPAEEAQLRLESDAGRVKIVTIHKSKGLQYPVVFCPFAWDGRLGGGADGEVVFHDPGHDNRLSLDLGSDALAPHRARAIEEERAEQVRLLYVAVTRAIHRCYLVWGPMNDAPTSALGYLLHPPEEADADDLPEQTAVRIASLPDTVLRCELDALAARAPGSICIETPWTPAPSEKSPPPAAAGPLRARRFGGAIARDWRVASFSSLTTGPAHGADLPDHDRAGGEAPEPDETPLSGIHAFPRGTAAGTMFHRLLQYLDFRATDDDLAAAATDQLRDAGFDPSWRDTLAAHVRGVLDTPWSSVHPTLRLAGAGPDQRLDELEFHYPIGRLSPAGLRDLVHISGAGTTEWEPGFTPVRGLMKGYIDLVLEHQGRYYVIDYKSNWLGPGIDSYRAGRLAPAMVAAGYVLQYHLYAVALHRYLKTRLPDYSYARHFGGIYYLYLRGMDPVLGPASGVYHDRPGEDRIAALDEYLKRGG